MKDNLANQFASPREWIDEDDLAFARTVHRWAQQEVVEQRTVHGESYDQLLRPALRTLLLELGLQHSPWPEKQGGQGLALPGAAMTYTLAQEQVGRADVGLGVVLAAGLAAAATLRPWWSTGDSELGDALVPLFCTPDRLTSCSLLLPRLARGEDEPQIDGRRLPATITRAGQQWIVDGPPAQPTGGAAAQLFLVFCSVEGDAAAGPALVVIPGDTPGLERGAPSPRLGLAACPAAPVSFHGVRVPITHCVFCGARGLRTMQAWLQLLFSATTVGAMLACHEILRDWARERVIKGRGQPLRHNPLAASVMGQLAHSTITARLLTLQLARALTAPERYGPPDQGQLMVTASAVWQQVIHAAEQGLGRAMELMGSAGYAREWQLERYWRDVKALQLQLGSSVFLQLEAAAHYHGSREPAAHDSEEV